ncbi:MAG: hypothetical protein V4726_11735 [Verrucomicrobiota bacterium]
MDHSPPSPPRLAYSFPHGTFDLEEVRPDACVYAEEDGTAAVALEENWLALFPRLRGLGGVLASVMGGPLSVAQTWMTPDFLRVPGSDILMETVTGSEIDMRRLGRVLAVVEQGHDSQELANLQFFDLAGAGCLKILLTNLSDLDAFHRIVADFGCSYRMPTPPPRRASEENGALPLCRPSTGQVRGLWHGLGRSAPDHFFPGLDEVPRLSALDAAGPDLTWPIDHDTFMRALDCGMEPGATLEVTVRNAALLSHASLNPTHRNQCPCGTTFFSPWSQLTLRRPVNPGPVRVSQLPAAPRQPAALQLEYYTATHHLSGTVRLSTEAGFQTPAQWEKILRPDSAG